MHCHLPRRGIWLFLSKPGYVLKKLKSMYTGLIILLIIYTLRVLFRQRKASKPAPIVEFQSPFPLYDLVLLEHPELHKRLVIKAQDISVVYSPASGVAVPVHQSNTVDIYCENSVRYRLKNVFCFQKSPFEIVAGAHLGHYYDRSMITLHKNQLEIELYINDQLVNPFNYINPSLFHLPNNLQ